MLKVFYLVAIVMIIATFHTLPMIMSQLNMSMYQLPNAVRLPFAPNATTYTSTSSPNSSSNSPPNPPDPIAAARNAARDLREPKQRPQRGGFAAASGGCEKGQCANRNPSR